VRAVSCAHCGLCFLNPQYPPEAYEYFYTSKYFDEMASDYAAQSAALTRDYRAAVEPILAQYLQDFPDKGIFADIGAGSGTWLEIFKSIKPHHDNRRIVAIEPSEMACEDLARRFPNLRISATTLERAVLPPASLDVILCSALIEHFNEPLLSLLHMNSFLKHDGLLIMLTPSLERSALRRGAARFFKFVHTFYYTKKTLDALARKAGFVTVQSRIVPPQKQSLLWFPLLVTVHRKVEALVPEDANYRRRPAATDLENLAEVQALFAPVSGRFAREKILRTVKRRLRVARNFLFRRAD
jgi:SAM-dependent methyltransferase